MTDEDIQKMQDDLASALSSIKALEATNKKLKQEKTDASKAAADAKDAADAAAQEAAEKSGDIEAIKKSLMDAHAKELKKLTDANTALNRNLEKLTVDDAISSAIAKAGVLPQHVRAMTLLMKDGVVFDQGTATRDGQPLADALTAFLGSDDAAPYLPASGSSGAGARGSTSTTAPAPNSLDALMAAAKSGALQGDLSSVVSGVQSPTR